MIQARAIQRQRFGINRSKVRCNARMSSEMIKEHFELDEEFEGMLQVAMSELNFSARADDRILKVARTIADLDGSERIQSQHLAEAVQYRTLDRKLWP